MIACKLACHKACVTCDATEALEDLGLRYNGLSAMQEKIVKRRIKQANQFVLGGEYYVELRHSTPAGED